MPLTWVCFPAAPSLEHGVYSGTFPAANSRNTVGYHSCTSSSFQVSFLYLCGHLLFPMGASCHHNATVPLSPLVQGYSMCDCFSMATCL